jgi:L-amino acid N-acyltransferase
VQIRTARLTDAEAIRGIYNRAILTVATFDMEERSLDEQQQWLAMRSGAHIALVAADEGGTLAGFASLSPYRDRPAYRTTVENSVYVDQSFQGKGVGKALMSALVDAARDHGFHSVIARIVSSNAASIALHRAVGFEIVGVEKEVGRKLGRWLDVVVMQRMLSVR